MSDQSPPVVWAHYVNGDRCRAGRLNGPPHGEEQRADISVSEERSYTVIGAPHNAEKQPEGTWHHKHECSRKK